MDETLDISLLRTFVASEEGGGCGRAAAALHRSQPTVSQHVRALERRIGHALVERDGRAARFTDVGERLLVEARRIIAVHDEALARLDGAGARPLVVGVPEVLAGALVAVLAVAVAEAQPARPVTFAVDRSGPLLDAVITGTLDLAVVLDLDRDAPGIEAAALPLRWWAAPGWRPPQGDASVPVVTWVEPPGIGQQIIEQLRAAGLHAETAVESIGFDGARAAARAGLGAVVLPELADAHAGLEPCDELPSPGRAAVRVVARQGLGTAVPDAAIRAVSSALPR